MRLLGTQERRPSRRKGSQAALTGVKTTSPGAGRENMARGPGLAAFQRLHRRGMSLSLLSLQEGHRVWEMSDGIRTRGLGSGRGSLLSKPDCIHHLASM